MHADSGDVLVYVGVDEAGYGPRLGPLCVAYSAFELRGWQPGGKPPDLWRMLRKAVSREPSRTRSGLLAVGDSKRLRLPARRGAKALHPLTHLERGVLAFLATAGRTPRSDGELLHALHGAAPSDLPWYAGDAFPLPFSTTPEHMSVLASSVTRACENAGVRFLTARCRAMDERLFNERLGRMRSKAAVSFGVIASILRRVWQSQAARPDLVEGGPRVVIDRQGGRTRYAEVLARAVPGSAVRILEEDFHQSRYELTGVCGRRMTVVFRVEAESCHFPVALASMAAKLTREVLMLRFNRYWGARIDELKPTAGYATDAGRWLREAEQWLSPDERTLLVRRA